MAKVAGMKVRISGRGVRVDDRIEAYAVGRVERAAHFFGRLGDVEVNLVRLDPPERGQRFRAEISTRAARHDARAEGEGDTVERALDAAADRFAVRLRRLGERLIERRRQRPQHAERADPLAGRTDRSREVGHRAPEIVRVRRAAGKPMTPEDAALVMEQQGQSFLVFNNSETGRFGVLYRRKDGRLGLIEPE